MLVESSISLQVSVASASWYRKRSTDSMTAVMENVVNFTATAFFPGENWGKWGTAKKPIRSISMVSHLEASEDDRVHAKHTLFSMQSR